MTIADPVPRPARVAGMDVARGAALLGMMAVHALDAFDDEGAPTTATLVAAGPSRWPDDAQRPVVGPASIT
jgi:uncharacterized membrane protein YeiB